MELVAVVTSVASLKDARRLARAIVERRLAACAELSRIQSFYEWQGALRSEREVRIVFKTTRQNVALLEAAIVALHPYEVPAVHASELTAVHPPYAQWVAENTADPLPE